MLASVFTDYNIEHLAVFDHLRMNVFVVIFVVRLLLVLLADLERRWNVQVAKQQSLAQWRLVVCSRACVTYNVDLVIASIYVRAQTRRVTALLANSSTTREQSNDRTNLSEPTVSTTARLEEESDHADKPGRLHYQCQSADRTNLVTKCVAKQHTALTSN
jgi:hypothetical protein